MPCLYTGNSLCLWQLPRPGVTYIVFAKGTKLTRLLQELKAKVRIRLKTWARDVRVENSQSAKKKTALQRALIEGRGGEIEIRSLWLQPSQLLREGGVYLHLTFLSRTVSSSYLVRVPQRDLLPGWPLSWSSNKEDHLRLTRFHFHSPTPNFAYTNVFALNLFQGRRKQAPVMALLQSWSGIIK